MTTQEKHTTDKVIQIIAAFEKAQLPKFEEHKRYEYVPYGANNSFPSVLKALFLSSSLHNSICNTKITDIVGNGIERDDLNESTISFIDKKNRFGDTIEDVLEKCSFDFVIYGGYSLNVIWSRDRQTISEISHINFAQIRSGKMNGEKQVTNYFYSDNWGGRRPAFKEIPAFNEKTKEEFPSQLLYFKNSDEYYPYPSYAGSLASIETDAEISNFHLSNIKNGMSPSMIINFPTGTPTIEERKKIKKQLSDQYDGSSNTGKKIITYSDGTDAAPTVTTLAASQLDKQFIQLKDSVLQNILSGHSVVSPMLVGIPSPVGLGGTTILRESWQLYNARVIQPLKTKLLKSFNRIFEVNSLQEIETLTNSPIEFTFSESVLSQILTQTELRAMIGYEPLTEDQITKQPE